MTTPKICTGLHCKCMNLDGSCSNPHHGDHDCPYEQNSTNVLPGQSAADANDDTARQVVLNEVQWVALVPWLRSHGWVPVRMPDVEDDLPTYVVHPSPEVLDSDR